MKKKICISVWVLFFIFFLILLVNTISNEVMINKYNKRVYEFNKLWFLGFTQPYISSFNKGDILYKKVEYEMAIAQYDDALAKYPTKAAECDIRVNKALAMLKLVDVTINNKDDIDPIIDQLLLVEEVLTEKGCANVDMETGHDEEAQILFNEIESYIEYYADIKDTFSFYGNKFLYDSRGNQRQLSGNDFEFSFIEVADENKTELPGAQEYTSYNEADGFITFATITYKVADEGTHYYYVHEIEGENPMIKYAEEEYIVQVDLTKSYNGRTLDAVITLYADDPIATQIRFANFLMINEDSSSGGGDGNDGQDGGSGGDQNQNNGDGDQDQDQNQNQNPDEQDGGQQEQPVDPIEQQLQDYMNQANEERNDTLNHDQNPNNYYGDNIW